MRMDCSKNKHIDEFIKNHLEKNIGINIALEILKRAQKEVIYDNYKK